MLGSKKHMRSALDHLAYTQSFDSVGSDQQSKYAFPAQMESLSPIEVRQSKVGFGRSIPDRSVQNFYAEGSKT